MSPLNILKPALSDDSTLAELNKFFLSATPFPHLVIDDFFSPEFYSRLTNEMLDFYQANQQSGHRFNTEVEKNKWGSRDLPLPECLKISEALFRSEKFLSILERITSLKNLTVTSNINSGGYSFHHVMEAGSYLGPHTDHTMDMWDRENPRYHVANIITYTAPQWNANWGGGTVLYSKSGVENIVEYRPNRALIFLHTPTSVHGTQVVSLSSKTPRSSLYYDFYSMQKEPYLGVIKRDFPLVNSPHRFFLTSRQAYLKRENWRYIYMHLSHYKNHVGGRIRDVLSRK